MSIQISPNRDIILQIPLYYAKPALPYKKGGRLLFLPYYTHSATMTPSVKPNTLL